MLTSKIHVYELINDLKKYLYIYLIAQDMKNYWLRPFIYIYIYELIYSESMAFLEILFSLLFVIWNALQISLWIIYTKRSLRRNRDTPNKHLERQIKTIIISNKIVGSCLNFITRFHWLVFIKSQLQ